MAAIHIFDFLKIDFFEHFLGFREPVCVSVQNVVEIGRTVAQNTAIYPFFKMAAVRHFGFLWQVLGRPTMRLMSLSLRKIGLH